MGHRQHYDKLSQLKNHQYNKNYFCSMLRTLDLNKIKVGIALIEMGNLLYALTAMTNGPFADADIVCLGILILKFNLKL